PTNWDSQLTKSLFQTRSSDEWKLELRYKITKEWHAGNSRKENKCQK
ncbi:DUF6783 domain-containing protein, partial [Blautia sp.]